MTQSDCICFVFPVHPTRDFDETRPEHWHQEDEVLGERRVRNVVTPTVKAFLPNAVRRNGASVVIAPGGAFRLLAVDSEGEDLAKRLVALGYAAFVLRYRLNETPADNAACTRMMAAIFGGDVDLGEVTSSAAVPLAIADAAATVRQVRERAREWGLRSDRVGMIGFSAGAMLTNSVATSSDSRNRPDFAASIYGDLPGPAEVPQDAPPLFVAVSADDPLFADAAWPLFRAWRDKKRCAELHVFERGGHGYGMKLQGYTSDFWIDAFEVWLRSHALDLPVPNNTTDAPGAATVVQP